MGDKIFTKTDRQMEDRMLAVADDALRANTLQKARAFKRTWIELAQALTQVQTERSFEAWGYPDFAAYCRKELHLRSATVAKLLGSYRFLEASAPQVIERAQDAHGVQAAIPSLPAVEFVQKATERAAADAQTLQTIQQVAFDEGLDVPVLARRFKDVAFPQTERDRREKSRAAIAATARRLSALLAEPASPVPKQLAIRLEEVIGEVLQALDN